MSADLPTLQRRAAEALAKLVAAGRIKSAWLPGMKTAAGARVIVAPYRDRAENAGCGFVEVVEGEFYGCDGYEVCPVCEPDHFDASAVTPDLSDPLTVQGLVLLAREAWGEPLLHVSPSSQWKAGAHVWIAWTYSDAEKVSCWREVARGITEAEAAVAALEAAAEVPHAE
jgi:hypothetical protein